MQNTPQDREKIMTEIFTLLKHFTTNENWGNSEKVNGSLLILLDKIRELSNIPIVIHNAYATTGHSSNSQHYLGNAVDFHFKTNRPYAEQIQILESILRLLQVYDFVGLGIYPDWGKKGFHLDVRGEKARWGRVNGEYISYEKALAFI